MLSLLPESGGRLPYTKLSRCRDRGKSHSICVKEELWKQKYLHLRCLPLPRTWVHSLPRHCRPVTCGRCAGWGCLYRETRGVMHLIRDQRWMTSRARAMNGKETAPKWQKGSSPTPSSHPMPAGTSAPTTTTTAAADIVTDDVEGSSLSPPPRPARSRRRRPTRPSTAPERDASTAFLPSFPSGHGLAAEECQERCTAEEQPAAPRAFGHMQTVREDEDHGACASIARSQRAHTSFQRGALVYPPPHQKNPVCT